jgi:hypothetical protein
MSKQLIDIVLPQLAERLHGPVERYRAGQMSDAQFARTFEGLLQKQYRWLSQHGVPRERAAVAIHGAVLVLTSPGLKAEAEQRRLPLEVIEYRAVRSAASDIAENHGLDEERVFRQLSRIVARYAD